MILLLLATFLLNPVVPIDIPKIDPWWRVLEEPTRIKIGYIFLDRSGLLITAGCLATIHFEQPPHKSFPCNNASGFHPFRNRFSYGWASRYFTRTNVRPNAWYYAREGLTGNLVPYLSFTYFADNFAVTLAIHDNRNINSGSDYEADWHGYPGDNPEWERLRDHYMMELVRYHHYINQ